MHLNNLTRSSQPDHPMPDPRPPTPPDENMSDPPPDPPHQPDHPMPPAPRSVSPDSPVILHYRHTTSLAEEMQRLNGKNSPFHPQVDSIDWGVMSLCRHSRNHLSQFFRLSWYLHHLRFLQIPKQKMKILNCQHLRKKKQPAVHQTSRRLGRRRRRSQMTMMSHLGIFPDMILHLHPILIRTIQRICRFNMKVRKS